MTSHFIPIASRASVTSQLKGKGRNGGAQERTALASVVRRKRNDMLPILELSYIRLDHIRPSAGSCESSIPLMCGRSPPDKRPWFLRSGPHWWRQRTHRRRSALRGGETIRPGARPLLRVEHLSQDEQRVLRLAVNRLAEKGQWDLDALKIEFEELIWPTRR